MYVWIRRLLVVIYDEYLAEAAAAHDLDVSQAAEREVWVSPFTAPGCIHVTSPGLIRHVGRCRNRWGHGWMGEGRGGGAGDSAEVQGQSTRLQKESRHQKSGGGGVERVFETLNVWDIFRAEWQVLRLTCAALWRACVAGCGPSSACSSASLTTKHCHTETSSQRIASEQPPILYRQTLCLNHCPMARISPPAFQWLALLQAPVSPDMPREPPNHRHPTPRYPAPSPPPPLHCLV